MSTDLSLPEAEALVERTKAAIPAPDFGWTVDAHYRANRKHLDLALEGLRECYYEHGSRGIVLKPWVGTQRHARRYSMLIVDTAALYGQTP